MTLGGHPERPLGDHIHIRLHQSTTVPREDRSHMSDLASLFDVTAELPVPLCGFTWGMGQGAHTVWWCENLGVWGSQSCDSRDLQGPYPSKAMSWPRRAKLFGSWPTILRRTWRNHNLISPTKALVSRLANPCHPKQQRRCVSKQ